MSAFHAEAAALVTSATAFRDRAARLAAFRARFGRRLSREKRADVVAVAEALEAAAAEPAPTDPVAAIIAQARALGVAV